jgi:hypothetical protein
MDRRTVSSSGDYSGARTSGAITHGLAVHIRWTHAGSGNGVPRTALTF